MIWDIIVLCVSLINIVFCLWKIWYDRKAKKENLRIQMNDVVTNNIIQYYGVRRFNATYSAGLCIQVDLFTQEGNEYTVDFRRSDSPALFIEALEKCREEYLISQLAGLDGGDK